jgi:hypothetical protein
MAKSSRVFSLFLAATAVPVFLNAKEKRFWGDTTIPLAVAIRALSKKSVANRDMNSKGDASASPFYCTQHLLQSALCKLAGFNDDFSLH